jgi:hypothetical protein
MSLSKILRSLIATLHRQTPSQPPPGKPSAGPKEGTIVGSLKDMEF